MSDALSGIVGSSWELGGLWASTGEGELDWTVPLYILAALALVVLSVWRLPDLKEAHPTHTEALPVWPVLRDARVRWFFLALFFHVLSHMGIYVFFSLYLDELGYSKTMIGLLWAVSVVVEIAWFFTQSRWLPRLRATQWLVVCALAMALRMALTAWWVDTGCCGTPTPW